MNFKFRSYSMDPTNSSSNSNRNPIPNPNSNFFSHPNSASFSYFTQQAIRAGFTGPGPRRRDFEYPGNPMDIPSSIQRELEKERIRAEIIAEEMMRRRILEEEVRRELMLEREMGLCRGRDREFGFPGTMRVEPRVPLLTNYEYRAGVGVSPQREAGFRGGGGFETRPFQRGPGMAGVGNGGVNEGGASSGPGVMLEEIKEVEGAMVPTAEVINKDKLIILAKPTPNLADLKRKALTSSVGDAAELLKRPKTKEDWSCALCRITATSERALNEHLQGKKHKARERGMVAQRTGFGTGPLLNINTSTGKPIQKPAASKKKDGKSDGELSLVKVDFALAEKPPLVDNNILPKEKETSNEKKENGEAKKPTAGKPKKRFRFFCELCKVGAYTPKVFNTHNKGKRHLTKLSELNKTGITPDEALSDKGATGENKEPELAIVEIGGAEVASVENNEASIGDMNPVVGKDKVFEIGGSVTIANKGANGENKGPKLAVEGITGGAKVESVEKN